MLKRTVLMLVALAWTGMAIGNSAMAAGDYPLDQFEALTQCMSDPSCTVEKEDRIDGAVADAEGLTYKYPICVGGCVPVCTTEACWCEADDRC